MNSQCVHEGTSFLMKLQSSMLKKEKNLFKCKAEKQLSWHISSRRNDIEYIANSLIFFQFRLQRIFFYCATISLSTCRIEFSTDYAWAANNIRSFRRNLWPHSSNKLSQNVHFTKEITPYLHSCSLIFFTVKE